MARGPGPGMAGCRASDIAVPDPVGVQCALDLALLPVAAWRHRTAGNSGSLESGAGHDPRLLAHATRGGAAPVAVSRLGQLRSGSDVRGMAPQSWAAVRGRPRVKGV